ncbi:hypothetical protein [Sedimentimonas flavescens]|uniref:hypothetical protein n=1 Tax=Sedimentimonas flavescens TaxID=2851012 RepID=UPI001C4A2A06|nr:hypothetical protein [Sedimentimonas flavescens]MBW0158836.1 hypothetical protein [Sedimentimonas flavescens]
MVGASKILTVSYGTFSCTLEGFDEPFSTMKAIAEYFRDLAADDRYFGAEPPQPDAEMLHRIAEREIQRRVEAKIQANGVVLRPQIEEAAPEPVAQPAPAAAAPAPESVAQPTPAPQPAVAEDSVAAKLQRIRAAVASARTAAVQPDAFAEEADVVPEPAAETSFAESEDFGYQLDISGPIEAEEVNAAPDVEAVEEPTPAPAFAADPDAAARRRAARRAARAAVLAQTAAELTAPAAPEPTAQIEEELEEITPVSELTAMLQAESAVVEVEPTPVALDVADAEVPLVLEAPVEPMHSILAEEAPAVEADAEDEQDLLAELRALRSQSEAVEAEAEMIEPLPEPEIEPVPFELIEDEVAVDHVAEAVAEIEPGEDIAAAEPVEEIIAVAPAEEIAEVEAPAEQAHEPELPVAEASRGLDHAAISAEHDADVSRLMEKADEQLAGRENRRRFSAIAHLKAAVAATVADRRAKSAPKADDQTGPYRADLSEAVRPRRPSQAEPSTPRPAVSEPRPAPLVLVSAQRIDRDSETVPPTAPVVRPRRIPSRLVATISPEDELVEFAEADLPPMAPSEAASFAEFAEARGAQGLTELLEAAAAYTAQVEGRPHFSPPQVMRKVASVSEGAETSREERLRGFGALLRQGKIEKVRRGQYAIAKASRYYDESKSA